jgi:hypothetical protein
MPKIIPRLKVSTVARSGSGFQLAYAVLSQAVSFALGNMKGMGYNGAERRRAKEEALSFLRGRGGWSEVRNHWCSVGGMELSYLRRKLDELGIVKYDEFVMGVEL